MEDFPAGWNEDIHGARDRLFARVYGQLRRIARAEMARQRGSHTLQATALVHEAYVKICDGQGETPADRTHFLKLAAKAMRQLLVDHARRRQADKRSPGGERRELDGLVAEYERRSGDLLALDEALESLATRHPQLAQVVELRFFSGHSVDEVASLLESSPRSVARRWQAARLYLRRELEA